MEKKKNANDFKLKVADHFLQWKFPNEIIAWQTGSNTGKCCIGAKIKDKDHNSNLHGRHTTVLRVKSNHVDAILGAVANYRSGDSWAHMRTLLEKFTRGEDSKAIRKNTLKTEKKNKANRNCPGHAGQLSIAKSGLVLYSHSKRDLYNRQFLKHSRESPAPSWPLLPPLKGLSA